MVTLYTHLFLMKSFFQQKSEAPEIPPAGFQKALSKSRIKKEQLINCADLYLI